MTERTWTKARAWNGKDLKGEWLFTLKIDGVRAFRIGDGYVSRNGKPLYNIPLLDEPAPPEGYEVYNKVSKVSKENFKATIQAVRAKTKDRMLDADCLYRLAPLDPRLEMEEVENPTAEWINLRLRQEVLCGAEGLVLRGPRGEWIKVKPQETYDVRVTGMEQGDGKHAGRLGALITSKGKVGTGFTDAEREEIWKARAVIGKIIEVSCMHLTADGQFRHPAFIRFREDKDETDD